MTQSCLMRRGSAGKGSISRTAKRYMRLLLAGLSIMACSLVLQCSFTFDKQVDEHVAKSTTTNEAPLLQLSLSPSSSLDRLLQLVSDQHPYQHRQGGATGLVDMTNSRTTRSTSSTTTSSSTTTTATTTTTTTTTKTHALPLNAPPDDFIYVNCATVTADADAAAAALAVPESVSLPAKRTLAIPKVIAQRSLLQCFELLHRRGALLPLETNENVVDNMDAWGTRELVTVIPRSDLFPVLLLQQQDTEKDNNDIDDTNHHPLPPHLSVNAGQQGRRRRRRRPQKTLPRLPPTTSHHSSITNNSSSKSSNSQTGHTSTSSDTRTLSLSKWESMGTLHFHFPKQGTNVPRNNLPVVQDLERFTTRAIYHNKGSYYVLLGRTLGQAFGCTWTTRTGTRTNATDSTKVHSTGRNDINDNALDGALDNTDESDIDIQLARRGLDPTRPSFQCPTWEQRPHHQTTTTTSSEKTTTTAATSFFARTWSVPHSVLARVWPIMYQLPSATDYSSSSSSSSNDSISRGGTRGRTSWGATNKPSSLVVDPITPSVAAFRYAFVEMETGRILMHISLRQRQPDNSSNIGEEQPPQLHRQVLIQPNSCDLYKYKRLGPDQYEPFKLPKLRNRATTVDQSGAHHVYDQAVVITATWAAEFYHTMVEDVPRLLLIKDFIEALNDTSIPIIVSNSYHSTNFIRLHAEIWGLAHRLTFVERDSVVYAKTLHIPEPTTCLALQPVMSQAYRNAIHQVIGKEVAASAAANAVSVRPIDETESAPQIDHDGENIKETPGPKSKSSAAAAIVDIPHNSTAQTTWTSWTDTIASDWIVVVRRNQTRYLRNHDDMMTALSTALPNEHWFVFDEGNIDGTFPKLGIPQWKVFARAKLVLAPHGAGLSNMLACKAGTHIVELLGNDVDSGLCFLHLALSLGMNYHALHMLNQRDGKNRTYEADIPHVVDVLTQILSPAKIH